MVLARLPDAPVNRGAPEVSAAIALFYWIGCEPSGIVRRFMDMAGWNSVIEMDSGEMTFSGAVSALGHYRGPFA